MTPKLNEPITRFRAPVVRSIKHRVEREGGKFRAGLIRGAAIVTRGEAQTHGLWLDSEFVDSVVARINANENGLKSRFTHPGLSDDGLGRFLGRISNARRDGEVGRADLHISETAHDTPDGNLAKYVLDMAEQHPDSFGMSIVFMRDEKAEEQFVEQHGERSPDADNRKNLRHARLAKLQAADVVDEPAANPDGLFHRRNIAEEAEALLDFALGRSEQAPLLTSLDIDPERIRGFTHRYLENKKLSLVQGDMNMSIPPEKKPEDEKPPVDEQEKPADSDEDEDDEEERQGCKPDEEKHSVARLAEFRRAFPDDLEFAVEQFEAGRSMAEAQTEWLKHENELLKGRLAEVEARTGAPAAKFGAGREPKASGAGKPGGPQEFMSLSRERARERKIPLHQAMSEIARERPDLPTY